MTVAAQATSAQPTSADVRAPAAFGAGRWVDVALVAGIVLAAGLARLPNLDLYTVSYPEGIRAAQLQLMAAGYRPCVEIFCNQGPLLFYALYPTYLLFGQTLEAVRSGVVLFSLVGIAGTYWVSHLLGGRTAAVVAALLVGLSPTYLKFSRLALAEVPAVAPAVFAVGAAVLFQRTGRDRWLIASALMVALSLLLKPVTLAVCVPVGLAVLLRTERRWRNLTLLTVVTGATVALPTVLIGFSEILEQVVAFRLRSRTVEGRGIGWNWGRIVEELAADRAGLFAFAAAGAALALARIRSAALPVVAWLPASLLLLLVHTPLHGKHIVTLIPPAALLAGLGAALAVPSIRDFLSGRAFRRAGPGHADTVRSGSSRLGAGLAACVAAAGLAYLATLPAIAARDQKLMFDPDPLEGDPPAYWYPEVVQTLQAVTDPRDVIVTDHPYLTFTAGRLVPPPLVESSVTRVVAASLTAEDAIAEATRYDADAVLLWADKLTTMKEFKAWVDRSFVAVRAWAADGEATPTLYVRADLADRARGALAPRHAGPPTADFEGGVRLTGIGLDSQRVPAGSATAVNLGFEALAKPGASYLAVLQLRGDGGMVWKSDEIPLAGLAPGAASWSPGRVMSLSVLMRPPRSVKPGEYALSLRLYDPRARRFVDVDDAAQPADQRDPKGLTLGTVTVLPPEPR